MLGDWDDSSDWLDDLPGREVSERSLHRGDQLFQIEQLSDGVLVKNQHFRTLQRQPELSHYGLGLYICQAAAIADSCVASSSPGWPIGGCVAEEVRLMVAAALRSRIPDARAIPAGVWVGGFASGAGVGHSALHGIGPRPNSAVAL